MSFKSLKAYVMSNIPCTLADVFTEMVELFPKINLLVQLIMTIGVTSNEGILYLLSKIVFLLQKLLVKRKDFTIIDYQS